MEQYLKVRYIVESRGMEMKDGFKISIVTVSFNSVKTIEQTISSVINQKYENIEYIIVDGGSTDGTVDVIKKYEDYISFWVSEPDKGIYNAMNKGINFAQGDYIQFLNSDDCFSHYGVVSITNGILIKNPLIDVLSYKIWIVNEKNKLQSSYDNKINENDIYNGKMIPHPGMVVRSTLLKEEGFDERYKIASDYNLFLILRLLKKCNFYFSSEHVVFFSDAGIGSTELRYGEHAKIMKKFDLSSKEIKRYERKSKNTFIYRIKKNMERRYLKKIEQMGKSFLEKMKLIKVRNKNAEKPQMHQCDLKICRWCNKP